MKANNVNINSLKPVTEPSVSNAKVLEVNADDVKLLLNKMPIIAKVAFSCLVQPQKDDEVICTRAENGLYYLLGIIERPDTQDINLSFPAEVKIQAKNGSINMTASHSVNLMANENLNCFADKTIHKSRETVIDFDKTVANGQSIQASFKSVQILSELMNTMAKTVIDKFKNYTRQTESYDQVQAGQMQRKVKGLYAMDSKYTVMVSKKDTKIDGERIHMG